MIKLLIEGGVPVGTNQLPYEIPLHPNLVHFTLGLFIIAVLFDIAGALFTLERPIFNFLGLPALRQGFFDVGWYNLLSAAIVTIFTVAAGFFELVLADLPSHQKSAWGMTPNLILLLHGLSGILLLGAIVGMTVWRGLQHYRWRKDQSRKVQWSYLAVGLLMLGLLYLQGTLGAQLGDEFGVHVTAAHLVRQGLDPNQVLK